MVTFLIILIIYLIMWGFCGCLFAVMAGYEIDDDGWGFLVWAGIFWPVLFPALLMYYILRRNSE